MHTSPQHHEAPALSQAFAAMAGELRALAEAAKARGSVALFQALILFTLVQILLTLEAMILAWEQGRLHLPPVPQPRAITPRPATTRHRPRAAAPHTRTRSRRKPPAAMQALPAPARPAQPGPSPTPIIGITGHAMPARALMGAQHRPRFSKPAFLAAPTRAYFITYSK